MPSGLLTVWGELYKMGGWRRRPTNTDESMPSRGFDHWNGTWKHTCGHIMRSMNKAQKQTLWQKQQQSVRAANDITIYFSVNGIPWEEVERTLPFQMVFHKSRHGADLDSVRVVSGVFKQAIVRVKQLLRQQEEKLSRWSAVVQSGKKIRIQIKLLHMALA